MSKALCFAIVFVFGLTACDRGVFTTAETKDGTVVVVNTFSGTVQRVEGDTLVELRTKRPLANPAYKPTLPNASIPKQPISIEGAAKYRGEDMLLKIAIKPSKPTMSQAEWAAWRQHILECRTQARLNLQFVDQDDFVVLTHELNLNEMRELANSQGELVGLDTQLAIPVAADGYSAITGWLIGWGGWPEYTPPPAEGAQAGKGTL
jgi:hypothetical protein